MLGISREKSVQWMTRRAAQIVRDADMRGQQTYVKFSASNAAKHVHQGKRHNNKGKIIALEGVAVADGFEVAE